MQAVATRQRIEKNIKNNFGIKADVEIDYVNENGVASFTKVSVWIASSTEQMNKNFIEALKNNVAIICGNGVEVDVYER